MARVSLWFQCCPGPRLQDHSLSTEGSAPWPPHSSSGSLSFGHTSGVPRIGSASPPPDRVAPQASSANARPLRHLNHAARAHSSCRYRGPSAASGSPGGGRCPPRTVFLRQAQRLAAQSANVTGSHVLASLAVPHRALPFVLGCHLVRAYGAHEHVSTPRLPTPPAPSLSASTPQQRAHPHSQVSWPGDLS